MGFDVVRMSQPFILILKVWWYALHIQIINSAETL